MLFRRREQRQIGCVRERIRAVVARQWGHNLSAAAEYFNLPALDLARLLEGAEVPDRAFLIDAITALAYDAGVDPHWLLAGEYDGAMHRHVLLLGEDRTAQGRAAVRDFVDQQFLRLRREAMFSWWPRAKSGRRRPAQSKDAAVTA
ncbi:MAG: hypothetical protein ACJ796_02205 [Gemmatimonadaceae bacterium]